jgi:hypothetical protein
MLASALQASAPAFQAIHTIEHAAHDARLAAEFGDLTHEAFRAAAPLHEHEPGESCAAHCASCKVQARLGAFIQAAPTLASRASTYSHFTDTADADVPHAASLTPAAPRAPPATLS